MDYIAKARKLSKAERERLLSRMEGKLPKRLRKEKLSEDEAIALQLELEDEQLLEWREKVAEIRAKDLKSTEKEKAKAAEKEAKMAEKSAIPSKEKPDSKKQ